MRPCFCAAATAAAPMPAAAAQKHGLIVRGLAGDIVAFCPPLIINEAQIGEMFDAMEKALDDVEAHVTKEGLRTA